MRQPFPRVTCVHFASPSFQRLHLSLPMPQTILTYAPKNRGAARTNSPTNSTLHASGEPGKTARTETRVDENIDRNYISSPSPPLSFLFTFLLFLFFRASRVVVMRSVCVFISRRRETIWELPLPGRSCNRRTTDKLDRGSPPTRSVAAPAPEAKNRRKERRAPTAHSAVARRRRHRRANLLQELIIPECALHSQFINRVSVYTSGMIFSRLASLPLSHFIPSLRRHR